jgi:hypothetical protein
MPDHEYVYQKEGNVGPRAPVAYFNKMQDENNAKLDVWEVTLATDEEKEANTWTKVANNTDNSCESLLFGIFANQWVINTLSNEDAAKRMFGKREVPRIVAPAPIKDDNKPVIDFGNLEKCEVMIDYISKVEPIKVQSMGQEKTRAAGGQTRGVSGGGNGGPIGPRAPAQHSNRRVVQKAGPVTMLPMSNMVEDIVFFTAAPGTEFRPKQDSEAMAEAMEGVSRLIPEEYRNVKGKSESAKQEHRVFIVPKTESAKKEHRVRMTIQVTQHDGKEDEQGEKVEAELIELIQVPREGVYKNYPKMTYYVTQDPVKVTIQNTTHLECNAPAGKFKIQPIYEVGDGTVERQPEMDFAPGETCELPYSIQKEAGQDPDAWLLCCAGTEIPVAKLVFKLDD